MKTVGALIGKVGNPSEALSKKEFDVLEGVLKLMRSDDPEDNVLPDAIYQTIPELTLERFGAFLTSEVSELSGTMDDLSGIVFSSRPEPAIELKRDAFCDAYDEYKQVAAYVAFLRRGGWYQDWIGMQVYSFADPKEPLPTPIQVMSRLSFHLAEFEERREKAMELVLEHPRLFPTLNLTTDTAKPTMPTVVPAAPIVAAKEPKSSARKKAAKAGK